MSRRHEVYHRTEFLIIAQYSLLSYHILPPNNLLGRFQAFLQCSLVMNYKKAEKHEGIDSTYVRLVNLSRIALIVHVLKCLMMPEEKE